MERRINEKLDIWIQTSKKALLIYGARQVGKTYSIREVLNRNQVPYFEINFYENPDMLELISKCSTSSQILSTLSILSLVPLKKGTFIFF